MPQVSDLKTAGQSVTIPVAVFKKALTILRRVAPRMPKPPILGYCLFDQGQVRCTNLDLTLTWRNRINPKFEGCIQLKDLADALKGAKARDMLNIQQLPTLPVPEGGKEAPRPRFKIAVGAVTAEVWGLPAEEFPTLPEIEPVGAQVLFQDLNELLCNVGAFASTDANRYILQGVSFSPDNKGLCATDGRRLLYVPANEVSCFPCPWIMPSDAVKLCASMTDKPAAVQLHKRVAKTKAEKQAAENFPDADSAVITFGDGEWQMLTKLVEGTFPNYRQVIPTWVGNWIGFLKEPALSQLKEFLTSVEKGAPVAITVDGPSMDVTIHLGKNGKPPTLRRRTTIEGIMSPSNYPPLRIALGRDYLLTVLAADCHQWHVRDGDNPLLAIGPARRKAVVMPLRLS